MKTSKEDREKMIKEFEFKYEDFDEIQKESWNNYSKLLDEELINYHRNRIKELRDFIKEKTEKIKDN